MKAKVITYTSGRDFLGITFYWGLILAFYIILAISADMFSMNGDGEEELSIFGLALYHGIWVLVFLFVLWLFRSTKYEISGNTLTIKTLGSEDRILISNIEKVSRTYNPMAAPAISFRRISIITKGNKIAALISPTNERDFLAELLRVNPNIDIKNLKRN